MGAGFPRSWVQTPERLRRRGRVIWRLPFNEHPTNQPRGVRESTSTQFAKADLIAAPLSPAGQDSSVSGAERHHHRSLRNARPWWLCRCWTCGSSHAVRPTARTCARKSSADGSSRRLSDHATPTSRCAASSVRLIRPTFRDSLTWTLATGPVRRRHPDRLRRIPGPPAGHDPRTRLGVRTRPRRIGTRSAFAAPSPVEASKSCSLTSARETFSRPSSGCSEGHDEAPVVQELQPAVPDADRRVTERLEPSPVA